MKIKITSLFISLLIFSHILAQQPHFITDSLNAYMQREMKLWNIPGAAIAIVKDNKVIVSQGYGVTDLNTKKPVDENTLFMIASNTKLFTGTSLALLDYQGRLSLEGLVKDYLPYFKMYNDTLTNLVTVEDILSHRLGFETFQGDFFNWNNNATRKEIIQNIAKNKPVYQFRDTWGYCNAGFVTAGEVLHAVTDTTWEDFIQHHFFSPLEMHRSSSSHSKIISDNNACKPYTMFQNNLLELEYDNIDNIGPCASINSCVNDLSHWLLLQTNNGEYKGKQMIPTEVIYDTRMPRSIVGDGHSGLFTSQHFDLYGLGIEMNDYQGKEMIWHTGGADGFVTSVCFIPEENLGIAVLTNTDANYLFLAALYQIIEAYFDMPYRNLSQMFYSFYEQSAGQENETIQKLYTLADSYKSDATFLKQFIGTYSNSVYGKMNITQDKGKLLMHFEHHPQMTGALRMISDSSFVCTYQPISWGVKEIPFKKDQEKIISLSVSINDFIDFGVYEFIKEK